MGVITVEVYPPDGMRPAIFSTVLMRDTIFDALVSRYGDGTLWDPHGFLVPRDQAAQLVAGDYIFFKNAQGENQNGFMLLRCRQDYPQAKLQAGWLPCSESPLHRLLQLCRSQL